MTIFLNLKDVIGWIIAGIFIFGIVIYILFIVIRAKIINIKESKRVKK